MTRPAPPAAQSLLDEAVQLARDAGEFTLGYFRDTDLNVERKADGTEVTDADRGAERLVREELARRHPDDAICGEEEGEQAGTTGRLWYIDPIDGTKAFTQGVPLFCNLIAAYDEHGPAVGVINMPALAETVYAGRGLGAFCNGAPAHVSARREPQGAFLTTSGYDYWPVALLAAAQTRGYQMRTWGDGYGYALVATGRAEAMVDPIASPWDLAPMPVIVGEAGGTFTSLDGSDSIEAGSGVATNGHLHSDVLDALGPVR